MWDFTPDEESMSSPLEVDVPFVEDARADTAPYYRSSKSIEEAQAVVTQEFAKLGAGVTAFVPGTFPMSEGSRKGYMIQFTLAGVQGAIRVAGLPMRSETETKVKQVRVQALMNVADWLKAAVTQRVFSPGSHPLVPYLLGSDGRSVMDLIMSGAMFPQLANPDDDVVDSEMSEMEVE